MRKPAPPVVAYTTALLSTFSVLNFGCVSSPVRAQTTSTDSSNSPSEQLSIGDEIANIERKLELQPTGPRSLVDRISAIEMKLFGSLKEGSLVERLERARATANIDSSSSAQEKPESETKLRGSTDNPAPNGSSSGGQDKKAEDYSTLSSTTSADSARSSDPIKARIEKIASALPPERPMPPRFYRIAPPSGGSVEQGDYLNEVLNATKKRVLRFRAMPVPVYITPNKDNRYTRSCIEGFESWERRSHGSIRFVQVGSAAQARIRVTWNRLGLGTDTENCALGAHTVTKWKKNSNGKMALMSVGAIPVPLYIPRVGKKYQVPPQIIEVNMDLIDSKPIDTRFIVLKNIVTHELGHALGLLGHSTNRADMMYPITDENSRISGRDLNTINRLYKLKVDIPL